MGWDLLFKSWVLKGRKPNLPSLHFLRCGKGGTRFHQVGACRGRRRGFPESSAQ